jgi:hypothetical protein
LYQDINGVRQTVSGRYMPEANGQVGFQVGTYDPTQPLVIDPTYSLVYSTYLGGNNSTYGFSIAVDSSSDAYVTGWTGSTNFPTTKTAFQTRNSSGYIQTFVTKFNSGGSGLVYSTYLGGSDGGAAGTGIALDGSGDAYVTGWTGASNFPTKNAFQTNYGGGNEDAFLAKLNPSGSGLFYSTYLGGSGTEGFVGGATVRVGGIAVDSSGDAYLTGITNSTDFPTTSGAFQTTSPVAGARDAFVAKVNTQLSGAQSLVYSTYLGTSGDSWADSTSAYGIAVDSAGDAYVTGNAAPNFPTTPNAYLANVSSGGGNIANNGGILAELNPAGSALVYSTYLFDGGGTGRAIAVDGSGHIDVAGQSQNQAGFSSGFVMVLGPTAAGTTLLYSYSPLLGTANPYGMALDTAGHIYVTGSTTGSLTTVNAFQPTFGGTSNNSLNAFVAELDPSQSGVASVVYSSYLGGSGNDLGQGIAVDSTGNAYVVGVTGSPNFPTTPKAFQTRLRGTNDAFVTKIDPPAATETLAAPGIGGSGGEASPAVGQMVSALDLAQLADSLLRAGQPAMPAVAVLGPAAPSVPPASPSRVPHTAGTPSPLAAEATDAVFATSVTTANDEDTWLFAPFSSGNPDGR